MRVVIQCANSKQPAAGSFRTRGGTEVHFVARPQLVPEGMSARLYARPDDESEDDRSSWRDRVSEYNNHPRGNPFGLLPAFELYRNDVYRELVESSGVDNVFVLSAGWGLIRSTFLTPMYDITFARPKDKQYVQRRMSDPYRDYCQLPWDVEGPILFFGGRDYVPLFCELTRHHRARKIVYYRAQNIEHTPGFTFIRHSTPRMTNWHYDCARALVEGRLSVEAP